MNPTPVEPTGVDLFEWFNDLLRLLASLAVGVAVFVTIVGAALLYWRVRSPESYEEHFAAPARPLRWRLWAHVSWRRLCKRCGLSASEQVTRRDRDGRQFASTRWNHPKLVGTEVSPTSLYLTVRARMGQTVEDLERCRLP